MISFKNLSNFWVKHSNCYLKKKIHQTVVDFHLWENFDEMKVERKWRITATTLGCQEENRFRTIHFVTHKFEFRCLSWWKWFSGARHTKNEIGELFTVKMIFRDLSQQKWFSDLLTSSHIETRSSQNDGFTVTPLSCQCELFLGACQLARGKWFQHTQSHV